MKLLRIALLAACAALAFDDARAQLDDPTARYQRAPLADSRRGDEPGVQEIPQEPIVTPPAVVAPAPVVKSAPAVRAPRVDSSHETRKGPTLPDEYLDPSWPVDGAATRIAPAESDNVQEVPLDDQQLDQAEREEAERYNQSIGHYKDPDEFTQDHWGEDPADRTRSSDIEEYQDPAEW